SALREIVAGIEESGGEVIFDDEASAFHGEENTINAPLDAWMRNEYGDAYFRGITAVRFSSDSPNPFQSGISLKVLSRCPSLQELKLVDEAIVDDDLKVLDNLPQLRKLILSQTSISNSGLAHLQHLSHLESLDLSMTDVDDKGLTHLERLTCLRELNLNLTSVSSAGVKRLNAALPLVWVKPWIEP